MHLNSNQHQSWRHNFCLRTQHRQFNSIILLIIMPIMQISSQRSRPKTSIPLLLNPSFPSSNTRHLLISNLHNSSNFPLQQPSPNLSHLHPKMHPRITPKRTSHSILKMQLGIINRVISHQVQPASFLNHSRTIIKLIPHILSRHHPRKYCNNHRNKLKNTNRGGEKIESIN